MEVVMVGFQGMSTPWWYEWKTTWNHTRYRGYRSIKKYPINDNIHTTVFSKIRYHGSQTQYLGESVCSITHNLSHHLGFSYARWSHHTLLPTSAKILHGRKPSCWSTEIGIVLFPTIQLISEKICRYTLLVQIKKRFRMTLPDS